MLISMLEQASRTIVRNVKVVGATSKQLIFINNLASDVPTEFSISIGDMRGSYAVRAQQRSTADAAVQIIVSDHQESVIDNIIGLLNLPLHIGTPEGIIHILHGSSVRIPLIRWTYTSEIARAAEVLQGSFPNVLINEILYNHLPSHVYEVGIAEGIPLVRVQ